MVDYFNDFEQLIAIPPYSLKKEEKKALLNDYLIQLTKYHYQHSVEYKHMLDALNFNIEHLHSYVDIPFLPVRLFKELNLSSVSKEEIVKTMTSSGTSGQQVSKIYLDRDTASNQTKVLTKIVASLIGKKRVPMLILDSSAVVKDRSMFSARGAGILGFSMFGSDRFYAFDENMNLDVEGIKTFLEKHKDENIFMFGFTFMIWQHFYKELLKIEDKIDLSKGILIHGGGWKKLLAEAVSSEEFKIRLNKVCSIPVTNIHDYYGMVEQTGTIYMECEEGHLHAPIFSDVIIRRPSDFSEADINEVGIIEVLSVLPKSYPGHALLTEDEGVLIGEDNCKCGRLGKYFTILGRLKNAEIRGCSDTYTVKN